MIGGFDLGDFGVSGVERPRGHHHHGDIDEAGDGKRNDHFAVGEAQNFSPLGVVAYRHPRLRQAGMQIDRVRHDGGADDADRQQQRLGIGDFRRDQMIRRRRPVDRRNEHFEEIAKADHADDRADDQFERPEAVAFEHQQAVGHDRGHAHAGYQRHVEQQRQADGAAEKLGEIGRHGGNLADHPHRQHHRTRKMIAAHFRKVLAGDDAELGGQALEQHGDDVGEQHDPEQAIAVFRAGLDVGGEIARVHIGDRGDDRGTDKGQRGAQAPALARQHLTRGDQRPVGQRSRSTGRLCHGERFIGVRHGPGCLEPAWHSVPQHLP